MLTLNQLKMRERALDNKCFFRGEGEEMVDHLLVHCLKARVLEDLLLTFLVLVGSSPLSAKEPSFLHDSFVGERVKKAWMAAPLRICGQFCTKEIELYSTMRNFQFIG